MSDSFVHLHCHTEYSLLDGCNKISNLVSQAVEMGMPALAITDHGVMYGTVQFYKECKKAGIKPIIGCEVYVAPRHRTDRKSKEDGRPYHFTLLAQNDCGYRNLLKLVSKAHLEGYYYKPRVDRELLEQHSKGIIALSGCLRGEVNCALLEDNIELAKRRLGELHEIYKDNLFVELMDHGIPEQKKTNQELIRLAKQLNLPLVATNDAHYGRKEDAPVQDTLVCIQTGKTLDDPSRMKFYAPEFYLKSAQEMALRFGEIPEALTNTLEIAERCNLELDLKSVYLPDCPVPEGYTPETYLRKLCEEGFIRLFGTSNPGDEYRTRLETELEVINSKGFAPYFLIIWDFIKYARENGIPVGPGRGSAAGSLVAYLTGITKLDPLKHGLLFERFLNPERTELPDIDTDFCVERRDEVIQYCRDKYGHDKVAQIITFGRMKARAAIRDVGRVLAVPLPKVDKIAKTVPEGPKVTLKDALETAEFRKLYESDPEAKKIVDLAVKVEGMARNAGIHAAGVVMSSQPLYNLVPLQKMNGDEVVVQFDMTDAAQVGLVKMDFLGLRNLTVIDHCLKIIEQSRGEKLDLDAISYDGSKCPKAAAAYKLMSEADTTGVFQLESEGMKKYLRQLKPEKFSDIVAFLALYRPGPLQGGIVDEYIRRRHGKGTPITYPHPKLEPILKETYGFFLYQEQVMLTANVLAGYSMAMADGLRKAMGKKKLDVMAKHRQIFIQGAIERGVEKQTAEEIFDTMEKFASYGFNKSHSAAYAIISFQTAYLKANYRKEYMAALLTSVMNNIDKVSFFIKECQKANIQVLPPDINESEAGFTVVPEGIRWGLAAIRNVGKNAVEHMISNRREKGPYKDLLDLCRRVDLRQINKRVLEGLIKSGAADSFGEARATLLKHLDQCIEYGQKAQKEAETGQLGLFETISTNNLTFKEVCKQIQPEFPKRILLDMEKEMLGIYLSDSPLNEVRPVIEKNITHTIDNLGPEHIGQRVSIAGMVTNLHKIITRYNTPMAFIQLEDFTGTMEVCLRPQSYEKAAPLLQEGALLLFKGKIETKQSRAEEDIASVDVKLQADEVIPLDKLASKEGAKNSTINRPGVHIRVNLFQSEALPKLRNLILQHKGNESVYLHLSSPKGETVMKLANTFNVNNNNKFSLAVKELLGEESLWVNLN